MFTLGLRVYVADDTLVGRAALDLATAIALLFVAVGVGILVLAAATSTRHRRRRARRSRLRRTRDDVPHTTYVRTFREVPTGGGGEVYEWVSYLSSQVPTP